MEGVRFCPTSDFLNLWIKDLVGLQRCKNHTPTLNPPKHYKMHIFFTGRARALYPETRTDVRGEEETSFILFFLQGNLYSASLHLPRRRCTQAATASSASAPTLISRLPVLSQDWQQDPNIPKNPVRLNCGLKNPDLGAA